MIVLNKLINSKFILTLFNNIIYFIYSQYFPMITLFLMFVIILFLVIYFLIMYNLLLWLWWNIICNIICLLSDLLGITHLLSEMIVKHRY
jgi:hypothetical protein